MAPRLSAALRRLLDTTPAEVDPEALDPHGDGLDAGARRAAERARRAVGANGGAASDSGSDSDDGHGEELDPLRGAVRGAGGASGSGRARAAPERKRMRAGIDLDGAEYAGRVRRRGVGEGDGDGAAPWDGSDGSDSGSGSDSEGMELDDLEREDFIPAKRFGGVRPGYVFTTGRQGTGYYLDGGAGAAGATTGQRRRLTLADIEGGSDGEAEPGEGSESDQELSGSGDGEGDEGEDALAALQQTLGGGDGAGAASALESDEVAALRKRRREEVARGKAVRQQRLLWERGLELRILLQRAAGAASRVPPAHAAHDIVRRAGGRVERALNAAAKEAAKTFAVLGELAAAVGTSEAGMGALDGAGAGAGSGADTATAWRAASRHSRAVESYAANAFDEWGSRARLESGATALGRTAKGGSGQLSALNQAVSKQVEASMTGAARRRLLERARTPLSQSNPIGGHPDATAALAQREAALIDADADAQGSGGGRQRRAGVPRDPESFDDTELYQQMLRELLESGLDGAGAGGEASRAAKRRKKIDRGVDTRASKGRKLRFTTIDKLVGFMPPVPMEEHPLMEYLRHGLFGEQLAVAGDGDGADAAPLQNGGTAAGGGPGAEGDDGSDGEYDEMGWKTVEVSEEEDDDERPGVFTRADLPDYATSTDEED